MSQKQNCNLTNEIRRIFLEKKAVTPLGHFVECGAFSLNLFPTPPLFNFRRKCGEFLEKEIGERNFPEKVEGGKEAAAKNA